MIPDKDDHSVRLKLAFLLMVMFYACASPMSAQLVGTVDPAEKITFDLSVLDEQGLYGPSDGKRTLAYEFCIPATPGPSGRGGRHRSTCPDHVPFIWANRLRE